MLCSSQPSTSPPKPRSRLLPPDYIICPPHLLPSLSPSPAPLICPPHLLPSPAPPHLPPPPAGVARARHNSGGEAAPSGGGARELTVGAWMERGAGTAGVGGAQWVHVSSRWVPGWRAGQVHGVGGALWVHESSRWVPGWGRGQGQALPEWRRGAAGTGAGGCLAEVGAVPRPGTNYLCTNPSPCCHPALSPVIWRLHDNAARIPVPCGWALTHQWCVLYAACCGMWRAATALSSISRGKRSPSRQNCWLPRYALRGGRLHQPRMSIWGYAIAKQCRKRQHVCVNVYAGWILLQDPAAVPGGWAAGLWRCRGLAGETGGRPGREVWVRGRKGRSASFRLAGKAHQPWLESEQS